MGRLIAVHGIRGFTAHGSVHRRQFAYRGFFSILIIGDLLLSGRIMKIKTFLTYLIYIYKHTLCYKIKSLTLLKQIKFTKQTRARTRRQDIMANMATVDGYA